MTPTTDTVFLAVFREADFPAIVLAMDAEFRGKYRTFADWQHLVARQREFYEGQQTVEVTVAPDRLAQYFESTSSPHNIGALGDYAKMIGSEGGS
jgi:hypothetical protein